MTIFFTIINWKINGFNCVDIESSKSHLSFALDRFPQNPAMKFELRSGFSPRLQISSIRPLHGKHFSTLLKAKKA